MRFPWSGKKEDASPAGSSTAPRINTEQTYAPPPGPPPSHQAQYQTDYAPPPEPPPLHYPPAQEEYYLPPPGPPPGYHDSNQTPQQQQQHVWASVPDTSLLPPPPSFNHEASPTSNASTTDADRAHEWCARHPLLHPRRHNSSELQLAHDGHVGLVKPREYIGDILPLHNDPRDQSRFKGRTWSGCKDACLISRLPLYHAVSDSPLLLNRVKGGESTTIYFEVRILGIGRVQESSLALGFCAQPYPTWRLPGWERGSLGVHGDDGRRYVNNSWGGSDFTAPFRAGDTVGLGMRFGRRRDEPPAYGSAMAMGTVPALDGSGSGSPIKVDVFFTRNGKVDGEWDLHAQLDRDDTGVEGLEGRFDIFAAVGVFGGLDFEVLFSERDWVYKLR